MSWFLHAGASSGGEREGLAIEEADESVGGQDGPRAGASAEAARLDPDARRPGQ